LPPSAQLRRFVAARFCRREHFSAPSISTVFPGDSEAVRNDGCNSRQIENENGIRVPKDNARLTSRAGQFRIQEKKRCGQSKNPRHGAVMHPEVPVLIEKSVIVVDDYTPMRRAIRALLKQIGFDKIDDAGDAESALERMQGNPYGLIISDWMMEPVSGLDFLKQVRADASLKHTPFLMVTAVGTSAEIVAAKEAGVTNYIIKPFSLATLKKKILFTLGIA
jgi:two-component system chemotaxis response regulator CheY